MKANGPMLLVCNTYRYMGHSKSDANVYRTKEEINEWKKKDPILRLKRYMLDHGFTEAETAKLDEDTTNEMDAAVRFAEESNYPSLDTILDDVYA